MTGESNVMTAAEYQTLIKRKKNRCIERESLCRMIEATGYEVKKEYYFHPKRRWRFDYCIPELKLAIEFNGLALGKASKSRHQTVTGLTGDCEKLNQAQILGWTVLQYTALNYKQFGHDFENIITTHAQVR